MCEYKVGDYVEIVLQDDYIDEAKDLIGTIQQIDRIEFTDSIYLIGHKWLWELKDFKQITILNRLKMLNKTIEEEEQKC